MVATANGYVRTLAGDHVGDLDDGIDLCLWEDALAPGTLDIKAEYSQGCDLLPLVFRCMGDEIVPSGGKAPT